MLATHVVVLTIHTLAVLRAVDGCLEAFAVLLEAVGLLAIASLVVTGWLHRHGTPVPLLKAMPFASALRVAKSV